MKFGVAKDLISPTAPMRLACPRGDLSKNFTAVHDDVYVRCLVLDDGNEKAVLMSFDLLFHDRGLNRAIEEYAFSEYKINPAAVVVSCTHAHTAPASLGYNPGFHDDNYEKLLVERAKACLDRAMCAMFEGTFEYGSFDADFNISRRRIINGVYENAPNSNYPHDTEFGVLCVRDTSGEIRSIVMNYACHPVFYPAQMTLSGEFPARLCQLLDANHYGCISMYFQSSAGDVRPKPTADEENIRWKHLPFSELDAFSRDMSKSVSAFVENGGCKKTELSIAADAFAIELEMTPEPLSYFEEYLKLHAEAAADPNTVNARNIVNGGYETLPDSLQHHCQTLRLADNLFVATVGGEPCFGVRKAISAAFEDKDVFFIGYTDSCAYVVDDKILAEGGYEPTCHLEYGLIGPFKAGLDKLYTDNFTASYNKVIKM